jgi:hypothetical protein
MNNYHDQSGSEPTECQKCFSSMTQEKVGSYDILKCDNSNCAKVIELKGNDDE